jgi:type II secretory pathway component GspD/PulD (secretin)
MLMQFFDVSEAVLNIQFKVKPIILAVAVACSSLCISSNIYADNSESLVSKEEGLNRESLVKFNPVTGAMTEYSVTRKQASQSQSKTNHEKSAQPIDYVNNTQIEQVPVSNSTGSGEMTEGSVMSGSDITVPYTQPVMANYANSQISAPMAIPSKQNALITAVSLPKLVETNEANTADTLTKEEILLQQIKAKKQLTESDEFPEMNNSNLEVPKNNKPNTSTKQKASSNKSQQISPTKQDRIISRLEFNQADMLDVARALADISGMNFVATEDASKKKITVFLQDITVQNALETITKNAGLWYRRDKESGAYRIMTTKEYQQDLVVYREDTTRVFSMLNPNPMIVAGAIRDLYPNRVILSFGMQDMSMMGMGGGIGGGIGGRGIRGGAGGGTVNRQGMAGGGRGMGGMGGGMGMGGMGGGMGMGGMGGGMGMGGMTGRNGGNQFNENNIIQDNLTADQIERLNETIDVKGDTSLNTEDLKGINNRQQPIYITINREHDLMIVRTSDNDIMQEIASLVKELDRPVKQVLLEMKILSLDVGDLYRQSMDLDYVPNSNSVIGPPTNQDRNPLFDEAPINVTNTTTVGGTTTTQNGTFTTGVRNILGLGNFALEGGTFIYQFMNDKIRARIQLLQQNNRVNTLSSPILLTSNNKPAQVFVGTEQVVTTGFDAVGGTTNGLAAAAPAIIPITELRNIGNTLMVFPKINTDKTVTLMIQQDSSTLVRGGSTIPIPVGTTIQSFNVDSVRTSNIQGTVQAKDGLTIAIGGLIDSSDSEEEQRVPILGDFPILGELFKRKVQQKSKRELLLLITPHIIETAHEGDDMTRDALEPISVQEW